MPDNVPLLSNVKLAGIDPLCIECVTVCSDSLAAFVNADERSKLAVLFSFTLPIDPAFAVHVFV